MALFVKYRENSSELILIASNKSNQNVNVNLNVFKHGKVC